MPHTEHRNNIVIPDSSPSCSLYLGVLTHRVWSRPISSTTASNALPHSGLWSSVVITNQNHPLTSPSPHHSISPTPRPETSPARSSSEILATPCQSSLV